MIRPQILLQKHWLLCWLISCTAFTSFLRAEVTGSIELGPAEVIDDDYEIAVFVNFQSDAEEELVFFAVDVSNSDESITNNGEDFSQFEFVSHFELSGWQQIPGTGFGAKPIQTAVEYDTLTQPLKPGRYELGKLKWLVAEDADPELPVTISLASPGTTIGVQQVGNSQTFDFVQLDLSKATITIPEPSTSFLLLLALPVLHLRRRQADDAK